MIQPVWQCERITVYHGESLAILQAMPTASVDAVITDPPYSSGGFTRSDRNKTTSAKYTITGTEKEYPEFLGDNRDQRSFLLWCSLWMAECLRIVKPGGYLMCFTDWRQLPTMSDALQVAGWVWRGIVPWDKTEAARPAMGWFRSQCEYVLTASNGVMGLEQIRDVRICAPGLFRESVRASEKLHVTAKPVTLMKSLMQVLPPSAIVLDPFAGSGTTLIAAREMGLSSIGIELSETYIEVIKCRLQAGHTISLFDDLYQQPA